MQTRVASAKIHSLSAAPRPLLGTLARALDHEQVLGYLLVAPVVLLLLTLVAYPFVVSVSMALTDRTIGNPGKFIGLTNIQRLLQDSIYLQTLHNTRCITNRRLREHR